jgi:hypothetical protein
MQHYDGQDLDQLASQVEYLQVLFKNMISSGHRNGKQMERYTMALMSIAQRATRMASDSFSEGMADYWRAE